MPVHSQMIDSADVERLGTTLLRDRILPTLEASENGKFIAVAIETGDYEIDESDLAALLRIRARHPEGGVWLARIGEPAAYRLGYPR